MVVCWMKAKLGPVFYCSDKSLVFSSKHLPIYSSTSWLKPDFNYPLSQTSSCNDPLIVKTLSMIWLTRGPIKFSSVFLPQVDDWKLWLCDCRELVTCGCVFSPCNSNIKTRKFFKKRKGQIEAVAHVCVCMKSKARHQSVLRRLVWREERERILNWCTGNAEWRCRINHL